MKNKLFASLLIVIVLHTACHKGTDPVDGSNATVTLSNDGSKFVTGDITVNPGDSIFFSYTITSDKEMKYVGIQKNPVNQQQFVVRDTLTSANSHTFTAVKKLKADTANGSYVYRIVAHDASGTYIGHYDLVVTVTSDMIFWSARVLQMPDTVEKKNKCYYSVSKGQTYNYAEAAPISNQIDFAYYYDTTKVMAGTPTPTLQPRGHTIYALTNTVAPFQPYDISGWTKNATIFKASSVSFSSITSAGSIRSAAVAALSSGAVSRFSQTDRGAQSSIANFLTGQVLVFKTVNGKYGAMNVTYTNNQGPNKESYILIDVKLEK